MNSLEYDKKYIMSVFSDPKLKFYKFTEIDELIIETLQIISQTESELTYNEMIDCVYELFEFGNIILTKEYITETLKSHIKSCIINFLNN